MGMKNFKQGYYKVQYPNKCKNPKPEVRYLSDYELKTYKACDLSKSVISWGAEVVIVPYESKIKAIGTGQTTKKCRYIVDLYMKWVDKFGNLREEIIEIKPKSQVTKPRKTKNKKQSTYDAEMRTWLLNQEKWAAAEKFAKARGWKFRVITESAIYKVY